MNQEDSVLPSDSEDDTQIADNVQINEIIPESDDDSAQDDDNDGTRNDRNEQSDEVEMNAEVNFNWKRVINHCTRPIQPWKGHLPPAPVEYFRQLLDDTILDNAAYQTNLYSIQRTLPGQ
jgi:hypothetical protein